MGNLKKKKLHMLFKKQNSQLHTPCLLWNKGRKPENSSRPPTSFGSSWHKKKPCLISYHTELEMDLRSPKNFLMFLYSFGHTEAEKIAENFFHWYHLAWFFQMKICKKNFLAKTHQEGPKIGYSQKNFFCKMTRKTLRKFHTHCKNLF